MEEVWIGGREERRGRIGIGKGRTTISHDLLISVLRPSKKTLNHSSHFDELHESQLRGSKEEGWQRCFALLLWLSVEASCCSLRGLGGELWKLGEARNYNWGWGYGDWGGSGEGLLRSGHVLGWGEMTNVEICEIGWCGDGYDRIGKS